jgi:hypothetical protein
MSNMDSAKNSVYPVNNDFAGEFLVNDDQYKKLFKQAANNNDELRSQQLQTLYWSKQFSIEETWSIELID